MISENKKLSKLLNRRSGKENPYGLSTPSSKRIDKKNSSEENQGKRGGAKEGHKGNGRKVFLKEDADRVVKLAEKPLSCDCGGHWNYHSSHPHCVLNYIPAKMEKVYHEKTVFQCSSCRQLEELPTPEVMPGNLYSNSTIANMLAEHYFYGHTVGGLRKRWGINNGTFFNFAHMLGQKLVPLFDNILIDIRSCRVIHADETPWSKDGAKGYAWFFGNDAFKIFIFRHTRSSDVPKAVLGTEELPLILVTDRYCGYSPLLVNKQYCFVHLIRDVKKQEADFPEEEEVLNFAANIKPLLSQAVSLRTEKISLKEYLTKATSLQFKIMEICERQANHPAVQYIQNIFRDKTDKLFHWVKFPEIPADNNYAERELRPTVIARKISFGSQSEQGLRTREILMTVLHTAKCRGHAPAEFLQEILNILAKNPNADISQMLRLKDNPLCCEKKTA